MHMVGFGPRRSDIGDGRPARGGLVGAEAVVGNRCRAGAAVDLEDVVFYRGARVVGGPEGALLLLVFPLLVSRERAVHYRGMAVRTQGNPD